MTRLLIPTLLTLALAAPLAAQTPPALRPGDDVRLTSPNASGRFVVQELSAETLTLRDDDGAVLHVPITSVRGLSVSRGSRTAGAGALRGAGVGFLAGAGTGILAGLIAGDDPPSTFISFSKEEKALALGILLGGTGALAGTVIGLVAPGEKWERVGLDAARAGVSADGGVALGYSVRF